MKTIFLIAALLVPVSCIADEIQLSTQTVDGISLITFAQKTVYKRCAFEQAGEEILTIDRDGDIFLRNKWVGYDPRLKKLFDELYGKKFDGFKK